MALTRITSPLPPDVSRGLRTGDSVLLSGRIVTARDQVHKYLASGGASPVELKGLVIYHCGPVAVQENGSWVIRAAGPTTSMREEPYESKVIRTHHPGAIMGKGGMGESTREALRTDGCVYLHLTGGAASSIARAIVSVEGVHLTRFGQPEAMWVLRVEDLPALVTMDSRGDSLHKKIESSSLKILQQLLKTPFS
jgi:tartrate/fumarate subfamily iron-sulfur-dependent hydro-lyase beta chain